MMTPTAAATLFWWLMVWHALADWTGLQGDFLSKAKNVSAPIPGVSWRFALVMHALIHAGGVQLLTQSWTCAIAELVVHVFIDWSKCRGKIDFLTDQWLHVLCKAAWVVLVVVWR